MKIYSIAIIALILMGCASPRPWTDNEKILLGASCLATVADMTTTLDMLNNGGWEINPIMGEHPSDSQVIITMAATQALVVVLAHYIPEFRSWILGMKTGINAGFAFLNMRTH